jgi:hypothetical protein
MHVKDILLELSLDYFRFSDESSLQQLIADGLLDSEVVESKWLGFESAPESLIKARECELNTRLPRSYYEFLKVSNGFRSVSPFLDNLLPIEKVNWVRDIEDVAYFEYDYLDFEVSDEVYFDYENQDSVFYRNEYFKDSLKVSEWFDGMCVFLNPKIVQNGEWEVLEYATWYPGVNRYRSFREYLEKTHKSNLDLLRSR